MALETVLLQIEMGRGRVKIRVKIIVLETVPLQIEMRSRRVKIRVKIIVLETVPFSNWRPRGRLLNFSSGIIGKRPFLAKSWPGAFWKQISAIWRRRGRLLNFFSGLIRK